MHELIIYFFNVLISGCSLGFVSLQNLGFLFPYIIAVKKDVKSSVNSVFFVFTGRLCVFTFFGGIFCIYPNFFYYLQTQSKIFFYSEMFLGVLVATLGIMVIFLALKRSKILEFVCKYDHLAMFIIGILAGLSPDLISKLFFADLILHYNNYIIGVIFSFFYSLASFFSPLLLIMIIIGFLLKKLFEFYETKPNFLFFTLGVQKISGILMIYFGIVKIAKAFLEIKL